MKKKLYVEPSVMVVKIQQSTSLLMGSDVYSDPANSSLDVLSREADFSDDLLDAGDLLDTSDMLESDF